MNTVDIVLTDGFVIFARQTALPAEVEETLQALNKNPPYWRQAAPDYREPLEVTCQTCGVKHCRGHDAKGRW